MASRQSKGERGVWQRRYWEHRIRDDENFARYVDYLHHNPSEHGLVERLGDWPWSSFCRYARTGLLSPGWAADDHEGEWGEQG